MNMFQARLSAAALLMATSAPSLAFAQEETCEPQDEITAEVNSRTAVDMAKNGQYEAAAALLSTSVQLDQCQPHYRLLYARTLSRAKNYDQAIAQYDELIRLFPNTSEATRAAAERQETEQAKLKAQEDRLAQDAEAAANAAQAQGFQYWKPVGWATAGVGVVGIGLGVIFALNSQSYQDDLDDRNYGNSRSKYDSLVDDRDSAATLSWISYGVGGVALAGGLFMALVMPNLQSSSQISVVPTPNGGAFSFTF